MHKNKVKVRTVQSCHWSNSADWPAKHTVCKKL